MASIQQSLNNLFAAALGAGFAVTQTPALKQHVEKKAELTKLQRQQDTLAAAEMQGEIPADMLEKFREKGLSAAEKAFELDPSAKTYTQLKTQLSRQPRSFPAYESPEEYYGTEEYQQEIEKEAANRVYQQDRERDIADLVDRERAAQEAKRGVQNAVAERRKLIEQLNAALVNVANVKSITDTTARERIK